MSLCVLISDFKGHCSGLKEDSGKHAAMAGKMEGRKADGENFVEMDVMELS